MERAIVSARGSMRDARSGLVQAMRDTREGLDRIDPQVAQAAEVMTAIHEGRGDDWKGTLGRLVNDPQLGEQIEDITASGREAVGSFNRFRSWLGMRVELDYFSRDVRFYAMAEIRARQDKFYLVEFERGPLGGLPKDALSDVANSSSYLRRQEIRDRLRFTAQFGKHLGPISVRGGLKDSTFGAGIDAVMLDGRLKLSADVYGAFQATPRLKVAGALAVFRSIYVLAGVDDALNKPGYLRILPDNQEVPKQFDRMRFGRDYFAGAMLYFTDEDISVLLRVYGALLVGLL
jgi:phospholipid/cholesterol/gamma-HCH transport system substrate-binding protein